MNEIKFDEYDIKKFDETNHIHLAPFLRENSLKGRQEYEKKLQQEELKKKRRAKKARIRKRRRKILFLAFILFYFCSLFLCFSFATKRAEERNKSTESHWYYDTNEETEAILVSTKPQCGLVDFLFLYS